MTQLRELGVNDPFEDISERFRPSATHYCGKTMTDEKSKLKGADKTARIPIKIVPATGNACPKPDWIRVKAHPARAFTRSNRSCASRSCTPSAKKPRARIS